MVRSLEDMLGSSELVKVGEYCEYAEAIFSRPGYEAVVKSQAGGIVSHWEGKELRILHIMPELSAREIAEFSYDDFRLTLGEYGPDKVIAMVLQGPTGNFDMTYEPRLHDRKDRPNLNPLDYSKAAGGRIPVTYYLFSLEGYISRVIRTFYMSAHMSYKFAAMMQVRQHDRTLAFYEHALRVSLVCRQYSTTNLAKSAECYSIVGKPTVERHAP